MTKENVTTLLKSMPDEFSFDELIEGLIVVEKINEGIKACDEGRTVSHEEAKVRMNAWIKTKTNS